MWLIRPALPIFQFSLTIGGTHAARTFVWNGIDWTAQLLLNRLFWITAAAGLALLASVFFTRFDPAKEWFRRRSRSLATSLAAVTLEETAPTSSPVVAITSTHLTPMLRTSGRLRFPQLVASELRLMLKGQPWWWYVVAGGLVIAELTAPLSAARQGILLAAWIWPILLWSQMGCRETRHATTTLLFSSERALTRQLPALWTAGVLLTAATGAGVGVRLVLIADWQSFTAWIAAVLFIPSLALSLGIRSGSSIPFEALYTVWWYVGPRASDSQPRLHRNDSRVGPSAVFRVRGRNPSRIVLLETPHTAWIRLSYTE